MADTNKPELSDKEAAHLYRLKQAEKLIAWFHDREQKQQQSADEEKEDTQSDS